MYVFVFKQKTAYELRIIDWSSDVFSSDLTGKLVCDALVLPEHETDLAPADPDVARGHIDVGADVAIEFGHKTLAKAHDLAHALALRIEVRPTLAATHRQDRQSTRLNSSH